MGANAAGHGNYDLGFGAMESRLQPHPNLCPTTNTQPSIRCFLFFYVSPSYQFLCINKWRRKDDGRHTPS